VRRPLKSGHEDFDGGRRIAVAHGADCRGPDARAAVRQLIARDTGDDDMTEVHPGHRVRHPRRLSEIQLCWTACLDGAEVAGARADVAEDHDRGGAARPALAQVGALGALADGVQSLVVDELAHRGIAGSVREPGAEPRRFARLDHEKRKRYRDLL